MVCIIVDVVKQKSAFQHTWFSNNKWVCLEIKSCHPLIHLKFCQATLSHNLRCKNLFDQILLESAQFSTPYLNQLAIFCPSQFQYPQGGPWGQNNGRALQVEKNIIGYNDAVCLMLLSKNLLFMTSGKPLQKFLFG